MIDDDKSSSVMFSVKIAEYCVGAIYNNNLTSFFSVGRSSRSSSKNTCFEILMKLFWIEWQSDDKCMLLLLNEIKWITEVLTAINDFAEEILASL